MEGMAPVPPFSNILLRNSQPSHKFVCVCLEKDKRKRETKIKLWPVSENSDRLDAFTRITNLDVSLFC